jgi:hypothetical protein
MPGQIAIVGSDLNWNAPSVPRVGSSFAIIRHNFILQDGA